MYGRRSRSMHLLVDPTLLFTPVGYRSPSAGWHDRGRTHSRRRHHYVGGVRTQMIGADSYPNLSRSPCRLILCGPTGSYEKMTRSSSTFELSRTGVYSSRENLLRTSGNKNNNSSAQQQRRATSCEDVFRGTTTAITTTPTTAWDSRLSESGVSLNDSRTDLGSGSCLWPEDVDATSQCSFGSSSAFHEITGDSEMDRPDSDCLSVPGSGYYGSSRDAGGDPRARRRDRVDGGGGGRGSQGKSRHDSGSREKFLAELTTFSGRSSPSREEDKEFYHSTPTKRGSPVLSIFPGDEEDLHFHSPKDPFRGSLNQSAVDSLLCLSSSSHLPNDSLPDSAIELSAESLPASPKSEGQRTKTRARATSAESMDDSSSMEAVREALRRRRQQFFASFPSLQDCSTLEQQQSAGESVQSWLTTGHPQRHHATTTPSSLAADQGGRRADEDTPDHRDQQQQAQQLDPPQSPPSLKRRTSVRDRVRAIEQGPDCQTSVPDTTITKIHQREEEEGPVGPQTGSEHGWHGAVSTTRQPQPQPKPRLSLIKQGGGAFPQQLYPSPTATETASLLNTAQEPPRSAVRDGNNELSSTTEGTTTNTEQSLTHGGFNEAGFSDGQKPTSLLSAFAGDDLRETDQPRRVGGESGTVSGLRGEEGERDSGTRLRVINAGPVTAAADQQSGDDYRAVSADDRLANPGAANNSDTTQRQLPLSADAAVTGLISTSDVYLTDGGGGVAVNVPGLSRDTHAEALKNEKGGKDGGTETERGGQDTTPLYHARPIQIVPRDDDDDDDADAEVRSVLNTPQTPVVSCEWQQDERPPTDMDSQYRTRHVGLSCDPNAPLGVMTVQEVSQHHERHVHRKRTTVQETVTTRRTSVRHYTGSPSSVAEEGNGEGAAACARDDRDFEMTDKTVSRITLTEQDNEKEATTTKKTTRRPVSALDPDVRTQTTEHSYTTIHGPVENIMTQERPGMSSTFTDTGHAQILSRNGQAQSDNRILDDLQEQLSVLSSPGPSLDTSASSSQTFRQPVGYKDHAEASLPQTNQVEADSSSVVRGTGSVFFTLDRNGSGELPGSDVLVSDTTDAVATDWRTDRLPGQGSDTSLHQAKAIQILPDGERVPSQYGEGRDDSAPFSQPANSSLWSLAGSSSSEINDSDDRCTSVSSHRHPYTDSDGESRREEDTARVHTFQDFLSGLQGQFTSDQPTLHRSVDMMMEEEDFPAHMLRPPFIQETILEADDENESTDEDVAIPAIHSFKSSLHFCVPESAAAKTLVVSSMPQMKKQNRHVDGMKKNITVSEDRVDTLSAPHPLQDLSDRLSSIKDVSRGLHNDESHPLDDHDPSVSHLSDSGSPAPSHTDEAASVYSPSVSAKIGKMSEQGASHNPAGSTSTSRRSSLTQRGPRKSQWVKEKLLLFQKLLNDFESQSKTSEQKLLEEMVATDTGRGREDGSAALEKQSEVCDDLYRLFTREHLEMRQSHVCPVIEDHLPAFRFKRFLRKKHNSKLKGNKTFRLRHQLEGLKEPSQDADDRQSVSDEVASSTTKTRLPPYHIHHAHRILSPDKLRGRYVSDVFLTDDADVNRSISSDSAYSSLSGASSSSRNLSDLDSTFRSFTGSIATDVSMDDEKVRSLSDVFDHPDMYEGDVDQARLDRLQVGHTKAETL